MMFLKTLRAAAVVAAVVFLSVRLAIGPGLLFGAIALSIAIALVADAYERLKPVTGLGDVVAVLAKAVGISATGNCGCAMRRARWNLAHPFGSWADTYAAKAEAEGRQQLIEQLTARYTARGEMT